MARLYQLGGDLWVIHDAVAMTSGLGGPTIGRVYATVQARATPCKPANITGKPYTYCQYSQGHSSSIV